MNQQRPMLGPQTTPGQPAGQQMTQQGQKQTKGQQASQASKTPSAMAVRKPSMTALSLDEIKKRIKVAAYDNGGVNWKKIFGFYDKKNTGEITYDGFRAVIRKDAKITPDKLSEEQLNALIQHVDKDMDGAIDYKTEFLHWLDPAGEEQGNFASPYKQDKTWGQMKDFIQAATGLSHGLKGEKEDIERRKAGHAKQETARNVALVRKRLRSAAYLNGKMNWNMLFRKYDRDNSGDINFDEFRMAVRKEAKVSSDILSEFKLRQLWHTIDEDHSGEINFKEEFVPWLETEEPTFDKLETGEIDAKYYKVEEISLLSHCNEAYVKARYCLPFLLKWLNHSLYLVDPDAEVKPMTMATFMDELKDGLHLLQIVRSLSPKADFGGGIYARCLSRPMCESNVTKALAAATRHGLNLSHMCKASDFYEGRPLQIGRCLMGMFESMQMRTVRRRIKHVFGEMDAILAPTGRPLLEQTVEKPLKSSHYVGTDFLDGTRIMALLVISGKAKPEDMAKLYGKPLNDAQLLENAALVNAALAAKKLPVLLEDNEWFIPPTWCFDTIFYQIYELWMYIRDCCQETPVHIDPDFKFKDGAALRMSAEEIRTSAEKAARVTAEHLQKEQQAIAPTEKLAQRFAVLVESCGGFEHFWKEVIDPEGVGYVDEDEFHHRCLPHAKMAVNRVFLATDLVRRGQITKDQLLNFYNLAYAERERDDFDEQLMAAKPKTICPLKLSAKVFGTKKRHEQTSNDVLEFIDLVKGIGGVDTAFKKINGSVGKPLITMTEFVGGCKDLGLEGDAKLVFQQMDIDRSGAVSKDEIQDLVDAVTRPAVEEKYSLELIVDVPPMSIKIPVDRVFDVQWNAPGIPSLVVEGLWKSPEQEQEGGYFKFINKGNEHSFARVYGDGVPEILYSSAKWHVCSDEVLLFEGESEAGIAFMLIKGMRIPAGPDTATYEKCRMPDESQAMQWLLKNFQESGIPWPDPSVPKLLQLDELDARCPGVAEERRCLFQEDTRRQNEVSTSGASSTAQRMVAAADSARAAIGEVQPDDILDLKETLGRLVIQAESSPGLVTADGPQPTTSLDARVVLTDRSEVGMWLQTTVVDRTGTGSESLEDAVFVLELRDQRNINSLLHAQLDVSLIHSIEQLGSASDMNDPSAHASFVIQAMQGADLGGSVVTAGSDELWGVFHPGHGSMQTLYVVAGPSLWTRREAVRFFDELRIMVHFLAREAPTAANAPHHNSGVGNAPRNTLGIQRKTVLANGPGQEGAKGRLSTLMGRK